MKAGLIPRLSPQLKVIYVEATSEDSEARILRGLHKSHPELPSDLDLVNAMTHLRRGATESRSPTTAPKTLIVIDQFEQWLHSHQNEPHAALIDALRQCDGNRVQAIVMVRDDFAMAAARFMGALDIRIVEGENFATVDLFDLQHAERVLIKFGQAFGKLPANAANLSEPELAFVKQVVDGLAQDSKVVSVRIALFEELIKGKPWTASTLEAIGGTSGIGVNFLEETFVSRSANPQHRQHEVAARGVLRALLPEVGTDIKGHRRSHQQLLDASGYASRPAEFATLLRILDGELRLITPTDAADQGSDFLSFCSRSQPSAMTNPFLSLGPLRTQIARKATRSLARFIAR